MKKVGVKRGCGKERGKAPNNGRGKFERGKRGFAEKWGRGGDQAGKKGLMQR